MRNKKYYVYYSYEEFEIGRGYIGHRGCPENKTPETDSYLGSFSDNTFNPTTKIILGIYDSRDAAIAAESFLHRKYDVVKNVLFANRAEQTEDGVKFYNCLGANHPVYGGVWYNDGENEKYFFEGEKILSGWTKGRKPLSKEKIERMSGENSGVYGKKCYNNGIDHKYFSDDEEIPAGWVKGRSPSTRSKMAKENNHFYGKKHSEATRAEISKKSKGRTGYNNGVNRKYFFEGEEIPDGFVPGTPTLKTKE